VTAAQLTRLVVIGVLAASLSHALRCMSPDSDPVLLLGAVARNATQSISAQLECAAEGV